MSQSLAKVTGKLDCATFGSAINPDCRSCTWVQQRVGQKVFPVQQGWCQRVFGALAREFDAFYEVKGNAWGANAEKEADAVVHVLSVYCVWFALKFHPRSFGENPDGVYLNFGQKRFTKEKDPFVEDRALEKLLKLFLEFMPYELRKRFHKKEKKARED